jgi:hypothetical protein
MAILKEGTEPLQNLHQVGWGLLIVNAGVAWALNLASLNVIQTVGSLALSLFGYVKVGL